MRRSRRAGKCHGQQPRAVSYVLAALRFPKTTKGMPDMRLRLYRYAVPLQSSHKLAIPAIVIIGAVLIAAALSFSGTR
jgi:hypothetical protein